LTEDKIRVKELFPRLTRLRKIGLLLAANLLLLAGAILFIEIFCRVFPIIKIQWVEGNYETGFSIPAYYDEDLEFPEHPDGHFSYRGNNLGFREDQDTKIEKSDSLRIVVLGDSHTDGVCWNRESYANRLELYLNREDPGRGYEVINAGTGKYSPFQYLRAYQCRVKPLHPDVVIVGFYIGNDFFDMYRRDDRPSCQMNEDGRIIEVPPQFFFYTKPGFTRSWIAHSYTYYLVFGSRFWKKVSYHVTRAFIFYRNALAMKGISYRTILQYFLDLFKITKIDRAASVQSISQIAFFHYFPQNRDKALKLVDFVFTQLKQEQRIQPFRLIVVPIPTKFQIESQRADQVLSAFSRDIDYIREEQPAVFEDALTDSLLSSLKRLNIEAIDLRPALRRAAAQHRLYYDADFHINPAAHDLIGREICRYLSSKG
jgi:hypothetical protein